MLLIGASFGLNSCSVKEAPLNTLSKSEIKQGWKLLFDGKTTNGWWGYNKKVFPESGWGVKDGVLFCLASDRGEAGNGGDIITEKKYSNFELKLEWKKMVGKSKFHEYPKFLNMSKEGYICLQDHGGGAWFRNIKIREL